MPTPPRQHLPDAVRRLAERVGAKQTANGRCQLRQSGELRNIGSRKWMRFTAKQWIDPCACAFGWSARVGPLGAVHVEDALVSGKPIGTVKALGLVPVARAAPSLELLKGELMRYLAELPWAPDALLSNPLLHWEVRDSNTLGVEATLGAVTGRIALELNDQGLPHRISGLRPAQDGSVFHEREWCGAFTDWRMVEGRLIPHAGRVRWIVGRGAVYVWRGQITSGQALPA